MKKVVYIAGPITGIPKYYEPFEKAMDELQAVGLIPLSPTWMPEGLDREQYAKMGLAMLGCADAALFLPGWEKSRGCQMEMEYCKNAAKRGVLVTEMDHLRAAVHGLAYRLKEGDIE